MSNQKSFLSKVVAFVNQKGGVGKSTLATNAAAILSESYRVVLLDTDEQGSSELWCNARDEDYAENHKVRSFSKHYKKTVNASAVTIDLEDIASGCDIVVVDTPGRNEFVSLGVISAANLVIIPLTPGNYSLWSSDATMQLIQKVAAIRSGDFAARFLLNRRDKRRVSEEMELALREYDIPLMKTTIGNRNIYENSSSGLSVLEIGARSASDREGQREMRELVREIERLLSISRQSGKTSAKNDKKKTATI
ncbi:MAG: AAA family ATPase [Acidobacteria bacterium]|jgi:chromosome partitioning protein|nr:AAA family ATPase [Acidobacteriota bacterium]MBA3786302.1 AAA family ATPase [Acidobacteriota bacterium]HEV8159749.1 AAA family ATPase [Pyrinomonadaceae bacterium]